jgi:CTP synthase
MHAVGKNPKSGLVEIMELQDHPFFVGVQFHPEYKSTVEHPHPLFVAFIKAAKDAQEKRNGATKKAFDKAKAEG